MERRAARLSSKATAQLDNAQLQRVPVAVGQEIASAPEEEDREIDGIEELIIPSAASNVLRCPPRLSP